VPGTELSNKRNKSGAPLPELVISPVLFLVKRPA
jgi:hypothetical protein